MIKIVLENEVHSPGRLTIAPSPVMAGSRRIIPSGGPTHLRGPTPSGPAQSAVSRRPERLAPGPLDKRNPVWQSRGEQMFDDGRHETIESPGRNGPGPAASLFWPRYHEP